MMGRAVVTAKRKVVGGGTVSLTDLPNQRLYQRSGTSAVIPIAGTYNGNGPAIQARVIADADGSEIVPWATVVASPSGGSWSANLTIPQGGWYKVEVRRAGVANTTKTQTTRFAIGDMWIFAGQSQQLRMSTLVASPPTSDPLTILYNSNSLWQAPGVLANTGGNGVIRFLNIMRERTGVPQGLTQVSVDGTSIKDWEPGDTAYVNAMNRFQAIGSVRGILWHQGGTGVQDNSLTRADYKTRLAALRTGFASNGSFSIFGVFPLMHRVESGDTDDRVQEIRRAHFEYIQENASTVNLGWTPSVPLADEVHQTAAGSEIIAYAYAHGLLHSMGIVAESNLGPRITGVTRSGAKLTLTIAQNGGTGLKVNAAGMASGFQVFPRGATHSDAGALSIASITLGGA